MFLGYQDKFVSCCSLSLPLAIYLMSRNWWDVRSTSTLQSRVGHLWGIENLLTQSSNCKKSPVAIYLMSRNRWDVLYSVQCTVHSWDEEKPGQKMREKGRFVCTANRFILNWSQFRMKLLKRNCPVTIFLVGNFFF